MRPDPTRAPIERATSADLVMRAMDARSPAPQHLGALLVLEADPADLPELERTLLERALAFPGCGSAWCHFLPGAGGRSGWTQRTSR